MICGCGSTIEPEREELGLKVCKTCAFQGCGQSVLRGRMIYQGKVGGEIEIMTADKYKDTVRFDRAICHISPKTEHI